MGVMDLRPLPSSRSVLDQHGGDDLTPAALVSGEIAAADAPHPLSVVDMFSIGIGPSSSHTVGPMRAGLAFATELAALPRTTSPELTRLTVDLLGSLGATGRGHNTDRAVLLGLSGHSPESVSIEVVESTLPTLARTGVLPLAGGLSVPFGLDSDIRFLPRIRLPYHVNALTITAWGPSGSTVNDEAGVTVPDDVTAQPLLRRTYYSIGGGFVMAQTNDDPSHPEVASLATSGAARAMNLPAPHPFATSAELLVQCAREGLSIAQIVRANEESARPAAEVDGHMDRISDAMFGCVDAGVRAGGILPGGLDVPRRAHTLALKLIERSGERSGGRTTGSEGDPASPHAWTSTPDDPMRAMDWVNLFALAVNEENAAGHRIVTAPTNGAAGVVPAVLGYLVSYCPEAGAAIGSSPANAVLAVSASTDPRDGEGLAPLFPFHLADEHHSDPDDGARIPESVDQRSIASRRRAAIYDFLLAATAIGGLIKTNASIAGAEVGCQGEVGSASAMAAAGLAQALGGTPQQVENAAEIAMEHSLGLTCDPVGGLVQIPCIERNAIAAVKAINAARMALWGDGRHTVSLDAVIETMRQTGNDMLSKYKETSAGGLAVNVVEC